MTCSRRLILPLLVVWVQSGNPPGAPAGGADAEFADDALAVEAGDLAAVDHPPADQQVGRADDLEPQGHILLREEDGEAVAVERAEDLEEVRDGPQGGVAVEPHTSGGRRAELDHRAAPVTAWR
jgi:hypothetical protein